MAANWRGGEADRQAESQWLCGLRRSPRPVTTVGLTTASVGGVKVADGRRERERGEKWRKWFFVFDVLAPVTRAKKSGSPSIGSAI